MNKLNFPGIGPKIAMTLIPSLILTSGIAGYIIFKRHIQHEYAELEVFFGNNYLQYKNHTPEFFPFPVKKGKK
jgi:protein-S-isoprenylcysteine O-methyltransferase Ste14